MPARLQRRRPPRCKTRMDPLRVPGHDQFVRGFNCCVANADCRGRIESHHVRKGIPNEDRGGTGMKPHDKWQVPFCRFHHIEDFHRVGHDTFEARHDVNLKQIAADLWSRDALHRIRYERKREKEIADG